MSAKKKNNTWIIVLVIAVLAAAGWAATGSSFGDDPNAAIEGATVQRGSLRISVVERGNLKAADSIDLKSEIEGTTTVLYLIEEGARVEPGDLVCELDTAELVERRVSQRITCQNADAAWVKAKQNLAIQRSQNESDIKRAERELEFAGADRVKYVEGDWPQDRQKAIEDITLAEEELTRANQDLEWSVKLHARGFLEQTQLDADRLAKTRSEIKLNQAKRALELLEEYDYPRRLAELEAEVDEKGRELERVKLQADARLVDYEADMRSTEAKLELENEKLAKYDSQIRNAKIHAPVEGMVVYAVEDRGRWGGGEPMQEGAQVRERQAIITIPSADGFVAEASLHESVLEKVNVGMPCLVNVDALEGTSFRAQVKFKALLPDKNSYFANPDLRVYRTEISLLESDARVRPGMSCSIEVIVDEIQDATYVPLQSVFLDGGKPMAFVSEVGGIVRRPLVVGQNNAKWVEILEGLEAGETVLLSQPAGFELEPAVNAPMESAPPEAGAPADRGGETPRAGRGGDRGKGAGEGRPGGPGATARYDPNDPEAAKKMEQWMKDNPEAAAKMRERMGSGEKPRTKTAADKEGSGTEGSEGQGS